MTVDFLDRPPSGLFFQPHGSNWPWTLPVTTRVTFPCPTRIDIKKITGSHVLMMFMIILIAAFSAQ
jgi:hypothetical protein